MTASSSFINPATPSSRRPYPFKAPLLTRFFNVLHYTTVALLVGTSVFLVVNVVGAAKAKKKSFREEQARGMEAAGVIAKEKEELKLNKQYEWK